MTQHNQMLDTWPLFWQSFSDLNANRNFTTILLLLLA